jgi:hypothetical protein
MACSLEMLVRVHDVCAEALLEDVTSAGVPSIEALSVDAVQAVHPS